MCDAIYFICIHKVTTWGGVIGGFISLQCFVLHINPFSAPCITRADSLVLLAKGVFTIWVFQNVIISPLCRKKYRGIITTMLPQVGLSMDTEIPQINIISWEKPNVLVVSSQIFSKYQHAQAGQKVFPTFLEFKEQLNLSTWQSHWKMIFSIPSEISLVKSNTQLLIDWIEIKRQKPYNPSQLIGPKLAKFCFSRSFRAKYSRGCQPKGVCVP